MEPGLPDSPSGRNEPAPGAQPTASDLETLTEPRRWLGEPAEPNAPSSWPEEREELGTWPREPTEPEKHGEREEPCAWPRESPEREEPGAWPRESREREEPGAWSRDPEEAEEPGAWPQEPAEPDAPSSWLEDSVELRRWPEEPDSPYPLAHWPEQPNALRCRPEELDARCSWPEEPEDCGPARGLYSGASGAMCVRLQARRGSAGLPSNASPALPLSSEPPAVHEDGARLRAVFNALDRDGDGFVRIEDFIQFATVYGAEQVKDLTQYLDPSGLGVITFEDFHQGIMAIRNGDPDGQLYSVAPAQDEDSTACADEFDDFVTYEANEVTDSAYMGSESTYSECETFTDEDTSTLVHPELQPEGDADSAGGSAVPSECLDTTEEPDHGALLLLPGRYLHQSGALTMEALEDPPPDPMEGLEEDIADKVVFLERRVSELEKDSVAAGEQHGRLRQENLQLVHRANALEEQLKEQELRTSEMVLEEARKQKELLCKMEREKSIEIENLQARLQQLDEENSELRSCTPCLKATIERLEEEKQKLLDEIEELTLRLNEEQENKRKMGDRLSHERHQFQRDKEATQELIEDLRKQLEHLQLLRLETEQKRGRSSSQGLQEYNSRARESELEQEVRRLKQDNRNLKEQNDELNGQVITLSIQGAKSLFSTAFSESLAAEISSVSRDELMEAIQKQEEINFRLQDYIDRIIVAIMETNPSILEVK
ncbi:rab11 family-interacting protein 3 isoform X5 [Perognathus longimembris pacificus]|uniref:rab11 family-interacting protein 3 isoform X5 n=1 Tax=Perognathus longimembris pacificus TaxID=214514 RepID=UPI0020198E1F|nr:rab11 family-interacting protein 3 isoform X5 [Perognathus longimembris pacificus]